MHKNIFFFIFLLFLFIFIKSSEKHTINLRPRYIYLFFKDLMFKVAVICGSLRKASTNAGLLRAILNANDTRFVYSWINIHDFPVFNEDIEAEGIPQAVQVARNIVAESDAVLFGVP